MLIRKCSTSKPFLSNSSFFTDIYTDWLSLQLAQMRRTRDLAIFILTTTTDMIALPLAHSLRVIMALAIIMFVYAMYPCATWRAWLYAHIIVMTFTHFGQNWSLGCLLTLYGPMWAMWRFLDAFFFFCLGVWAPWKKEINPAENWGEHLGA